MKRTLSFILTVVMVFGILTSMPIAVNAVSGSGSCGSNVKWNYNAGTLTISGTGKMYDYTYKSEAPWASYRSLIASINIEPGVTSIGAYAFFNCSKLIYASIGSDVTSIEEYAFYGCRTMGGAVIPDSVTYIGSNAFQSCSELNTILLPDGGTNIARGAFDGTKYYENSENWEDGLLYIDNHLIEAKTTISGHCEIKESTKSIAESAFSNCSNMTSVSFGDNLELIGDSAFLNYSRISAIYITDIATWCNINFIGSYSNPLQIGGTLYLNGELITDVTVPEGVQSIPDFAFCDCDSLTSIVLPESITSIGKSAFKSCDGLESIVVPEDVVSIGEEAFFLSSNLTSVTLPKSLKNIHKGAFCFTNIKYVFYTGTYEQSQEINIEINNGEITETIWHYGTTEHTISGWRVDEKATCTQEGLKHKECTVCEEILETATIAKTKHTAGSWKTEKKATVNSAGKKVKKCTECGKTLDTATIKQLKCSKPKLSKIENTADGVKITWGKVSGADKYYVYRKTSSGKYTKITTTTKTYYTDKKASSGKNYYYIVKAVNEAGSSDSSNSLSKLYLADTTLKTPSSTKKGIVLKWSKVTGADGYMVYRKTGSGSYSKIATVKGNSKVTYTDKKAKKGKTYTYKIKVYKSKTYSAYSNTKKIKDKY